MIQPGLETDRRLITCTDYSCNTAVQAARGGSKGAVVQKRPLSVFSCSQLGEYRLISGYPRWLPPPSFHFCCSFRLLPQLARRSLLQHQKEVEEATSF